MDDIPRHDFGADRYDYVEIDGAPFGEEPSGEWWEKLLDAPCPDCRANLFAQYRGGVPSQRTSWSITVAHDDSCPALNATYGNSLRSRPSAYFGVPWPSGVCDEGHQVPTPTGEACFHCTEAVIDGDQGTFINAGAHPVHRECGLRSVVGGIGHLEDHAYWCDTIGDPDGGRTYRQSALEVWVLWIERHR